jgi:hypothetical protein
MPWLLPRKTLRADVTSGRRKKLEKLNHLLQHDEEELDKKAFMSSFIEILDNLPEKQEVSETQKKT